MSSNGRRLQLGKLVVTSMLNSGKQGRGQVQKPQGNVIILHGSCDTGSGMRDWLKSICKREFAFPNYRVLYPSAPAQKYTLLSGHESPVWFDRLSLGPQMPEDKASLDQIAAELSAFLKNESERSGISLEKTVIGGFSTGGIMALHMAFRFHPELAGVFSLASFLSSDSFVYKDLEIHQGSTTKRSNRHLKPIDEISLNVDSQVNKFPRLFMSQGSRDPLVSYRWGKETHKKLRDYGVEGHFYTIPNAEHGIVSSQLDLLHNWIGKTLEDPCSPNPRKRIKPKKHHVNDESSTPAFD